MSCPVAIRGAARDQGNPSFNLKKKKTATRTTKMDLTLLFFFSFGWKGSRVISTLPRFVNIYFLNQCRSVKLFLSDN